MNSQIELAESATLLDKLIDRTRERKLVWQSADPSLGSAGRAEVSDESLEFDRFATHLSGPSHQAVVGKREDGLLIFSLVEHDPRWEDQSIFTAVAGFNPPLAPDKIVLKVSVEPDPAYGFDSKLEKDVAALLVDLYALARRSALKIDASVSSAISYLDQLAG